MIKENIKPIILGLSFIIGVIIYTEQTKYVLVDNDESDNLNYFLLNRTNGEVSSYYLRNGNVEVRRVKKSGKTTFNENKIEDLTKEE